MRKIKLFAGCLLAAALMATCVGCGSDDSTTSTATNTTTTAEETTTVEETTEAPVETDAPEDETEEETTEAPNEEPAAQEINLSLCIYANHGESVPEVGTPVTVTEEGTYTVVFDVVNDLSDLSVTEDIGEFGSIYIKDYDVMSGLAATSPVASCTIVYDSVVVDGDELTVVDTEPAEAVNASGIFDTGKPMNGWDGSVIDESQYTLNGNSISFAGHEAAMKVEVTFTLSDIVWAE